MPPTPKPLSERLLKMSIPEPNTGCWLWMGTVVTGGYGTIGVPTGHGSPPKRRAHRVAYETFVGPIPDGLEIDHKCRMPACINPQHLRPLTHRDNLLAGPTTIAAIAAARTQCPAGHQYTTENTIFRREARECRECRRVNNNAAQNRRTARLRGIAP